MKPRRCVESLRRRFSSVERMPAHQSALNSFGCLQAWKKKTRIVHMLKDINKTHPWGLAAALIHACFFAFKKKTPNIYFKAKTTHHVF